MLNMKEFKCSFKYYMHAYLESKCDLVLVVKDFATICTVCTLQ